MRSLPAVLLLIIACPGITRGQTTHTLYGSAPGDHFGSSVGAAGDVNRDGFDDVIVGAPNADHAGLNDCGSATVWSGVDGSLLYTFYGTLKLDYLGESVGGVGDWNGDGFPDVAVGVSLMALGFPGAGEVRLYSGANGGLLQSWAGSTPQDQFGGHLAGAGDTNLDGFPDMIVGAESAVGYLGSATLISGFDGSFLKVFNGYGSGESFGRAVDGAGDVDGDGFDDVVVGAWRAVVGGVDSGAAYVFSGKSHALLLSSSGTSSGDQYGVAVAGVGDTNDDGFDDFAVGAASADVGFVNCGTVTVLSGKDGSVLQVHSGEATYHRLGVSVGGVGDIDLDGHADVVAGVGLNKGKAFVFSGRNGSTLREWIEDAALDGFGSAVSGAGDVNADGFPDVIAGGCGNDVGGADAGMARVFFECVGGTLEYGDGCAGSGGFVPGLHLTGCTAPAGILSGSIDQGLGGSVAVILFGLGPAASPLGFGCIINIQPVLPIALPLPLGGAGPGNGCLSLQAAIPASAKSGKFTLQAYVVDPAAPLGACLTNGLQLTIP